MTSPNGATTYTFDTRNRLATATAGTDITTYTYTNDSKKDTVTYPNGTDVKYTYTPTNRIETVTNKVTATSTVISSYAYQYDQNGNRTNQTETQNGTDETTTYSYDTNDRLASFTIADGTNTTVNQYTFEGYNRKTETVTENGTTTKSRTYSYDQTDWLTEIVDDTDAFNTYTISYTYDENGNTILKSDSSQPANDTTFTYDARNQLVQTTQSAATLGQYDYNAQGLRVRHRLSERGDVDYYYDDNAVIEEHNATDDSLMAHYRYADRLLSLDTGTSTQYYHHDALGSTVNLTDDTGATQVSYKLDPWGHIRSQSGTSVNRQIFTGQEHDENTGLIYFGARYYDPDTARFLTQDTYLGESGTPPSLHRYLYAYSNPTVYIDLLGYIGVFFDGTGMDKANPKLAKTNVTKLWEAYDDGEKFYQKGVGSDWYTKYGLGGFFGAGGKSRIEDAYDQLVDAYNVADEKDRVIDIFGFSRGAAEARELANMIKRRGIPDRTKPIGTKIVSEFDHEEGDFVNKEVTVHENFDNVNIRFLGLFDTVGAFGLPGNSIDLGYDLSVDKDFVGQTRHATAADEYRALFDLQSILEGENALPPPNMVEKEFRGAHSDVGAGYREGADGKTNALVFRFIKILTFTL